MTKLFIENGVDWDKVNYFIEPFTAAKLKALLKKTGMKPYDVLRRAEHLAGQVGIRAVEVDAIDDDARGFYLKFGFSPLVDDPNHLFLPVHVIRKLNLPPMRQT